LCNRPPERLGLHVVREAATPVDLDDGEPLAILGLEDRVAGDLHLAQLEVELAVEEP
jgi:hypothetical protein